MIYFSLLRAADCCCIRGPHTCQHMVPCAHGRVFGNAVFHQRRELSVEIASAKERNGVSAKGMQRGLIKCIEMFQGWGPGGAIPVSVTAVARSVDGRLEHIVRPPGHLRITTVR